MSYAPVIYGERGQNPDTITKPVIHPPNPHAQSFHEKLCSGCFLSIISLATVTTKPDTNSGCQNTANVVTLNAQKKCSCSSWY